MKIVGVSNPNHVGVTIATQAHCNAYLPLAGVPSASSRDVESASAAVLEVQPDILVIGGWSPLYAPLLANLRQKRDFPIVCVAHGGPYHGKGLGAEAHLREVQHCLRTGAADWLACVDPRLVQYCQAVLKRLVLFLPHAFPLREKASRSDAFNVGLFGNAMSHKNTEGPAQVILDYLARNPTGALVRNQGLGVDHARLMAMIQSCSVVVHVSHLEAYPNVIQEAWSMGVPVIFSSACLGLARSPLLHKAEQEQLSELMVDDNIDPSKLWNAIVSVRRKWDDYSRTAHSTYALLADRTGRYARALFHSILANNRGNGCESDFQHLFDMR